MVQTPEKNAPAGPMARAPDSPAGRLRGRRRLVRVCVRTGLVICVCGILLGLGLTYAIGRSLSAPEWVRERIADRIDHSLDGMAVTFGDVEMVMNAGWRPRARIRDVALYGADGTLVAQLSDAEASLAMRPLARGHVQPKTVALSGLHAVIRRGADGRFALLLDDPSAPVRDAASPAALVETIDGVFANPAFAALTEIELTALTLEYEDARSGRSWTVDDGHVRITRDGAELRAGAQLGILSGRATAAFVEMNYESRIGTASAAFGISVSDMAAEDIASQSAAMEWLAALDAPISGAVRGSIGESGALEIINASLSIASGALKPTGGTRPIPFTSARSYFTYDPATQVMVFDELSVQSGWVTGRAEGQAQLSGVQTGRLDALLGQFTFRHLRINPFGSYPEPLSIDAATADLRLRLDPFRLDLGQLYVNDGDGALWLAGKLNGEPDGWRLALDGRMDRITPETLVRYWPEAAAPKPRKWVAENIRGGTLHDVDFALRRAPETRPDVYLDFRYTDAKIRFLKTMPPISGAVGEANLVDGRLSTTLSTGHVTADEGGQIDLSGTSFIIPDVGVKPGAPGVARVAGEGSVTAFLSLLNRPPMRVLKATDLPVSVAQGEISASGTLALPLANKVPFDAVEFFVDGDIRGVQSDLLVPGQEVRAARLSLFADQTGVRIEGPGSISGVAADVAWTQPIGQGGPKPSTLVGTAELSPRLVEVFDLGLPPGTLTGAGQADFTLTLGGGDVPRLRASSDLEGVTLQLPELGWRKPSATRGTLDVAARLGPDPRVNTLSLAAAGLSLDGSVTVKPDKQGLDVARFDRLRVSDWLDVSGELVGRGPGRGPDIRVTGGWLDMGNAQFGRAPAGADGAGGAPGRLTVALDRLAIAETMDLTDMRGDFALAGGLNGSFSGRMNGAAPLEGQVSPQGARSAVRVTSADAGAVLRAAKIVKQAHGGALTLQLDPGAGAGDFLGDMRITDMRVKDGSVMSALLNAVSIVGLFDELAGQGIFFSEVDARFGLTPGRLSLYEASAVGPSIGASLDGIVDLAAGRLDLQGVLTPAYLLNGVGSVMTRKGEGVFSFSFNLTGPMSKPLVQVNPLSVLAPGFLREVFRTSAPQDPRGAAPATAADGSRQRTLSGEDR